MKRAMTNYLQNLSGDDLLDRLGLVRKTEVSGSVMPLLLGCGIGIAVGVTLGMAFAPKAGAEWRTEVAERVRRRAEEAREARESMQ